MTLPWTTSPLLPMMALVTDRSRRTGRAVVTVPLATSRGCKAGSLLVVVVAGLCRPGWVDLPAAVPVALARPHHAEA